jgi:hypothetical protein
VHQVGDFVVDFLREFETIFKKGRVRHRGNYLMIKPRSRKSRGKCCTSQLYNTLYEGVTVSSVYRTVKCRFWYGAINAFLTCTN